MNTVNLIGRLTNDPELKYTSNQKGYTRFCIAVDGMKDQNGKRRADFIDCIAWSKTAELIVQYFSKGARIGITGRIHTTNYDNNGESRKFTDVIVNEIDFIETKSKAQDTGEQETKQEPEPPIAKNEPIQPVESELDLPFEI